MCIAEHFSELGGYVRPRYDARPYGVVDIVVDVSYPVGYGDDSTLERACPALERMIEYTVAHLVGEVHSRAVVLYPVDHAQALNVMREIGELIQRALARVTVRRMTEVVPERYRLGKILVEPQTTRYRTRYLADLERVRQPRSVMIALGRKEHLRFVL